MTVLNHIQWLHDLIGVEIVLWNRIDAHLRQEHDLSLAFFQSLYFTAHSPEGTLRIGDLAQALRITVGATSKLVDRIEAAGFLYRTADPEDRRASRVALTEAGQTMLSTASASCAAEMAALLDATFSADEQAQMHTLMKRLLATVEGGESLL